MAVGEWRHDDARCQWELGENLALDIPDAGQSVWTCYGTVTDETIARLPGHSQAFREHLISHYRQRFGSLPPPLQEIADELTRQAAARPTRKRRKPKSSRGS